MKKISTNHGKEFRFYTPRELKAHLDEYVIGQEEAKKILSVAVYNHYKRLYITDEHSDLVIDKSNICLLGPTGCGKTHMIKTIAKFMGLPYYIADATTLTQAGYVGDDVESILVGLVRAAGGDISLAEKGIVVIDEIDKLAKRGSNEHISRDVVGEGVQQALLKMVEGDVIGIPPAEGRKHPEQQLNYINTKNILFIGAGAFSGIESIAKAREGSKSVGFDVARLNKVGKDEVYNTISSEDLRRYGMIPEFIGRFPIIANVEPLSEEALVKILTEPKNSILRQYTAMFSVDGIKLCFEEESLKYVAKMAKKLGTGARGLRAVIETVMTDFVFMYGGGEGGELTITEADVKKSLGKRYELI